MQTEVSITKCSSYEIEEVEQALIKVLDPIGGLDFVKPGMKIAVKLNLVAPMKPDTAATIHPSVVCALTKLLKEKSADVIIGDSPGGLYTAPYLKVVYDTCGIRQAEEYGAKLNEDFSQMEIDYPEAVKAHHFPYTAWLSKVDAIIDLCKLKTHGMMGLSCAVKNFFGTIPGTKKPEFHYMYPKTEDFSDMLIDLFEYSKPVLCICDAVVGMEGNGPTQGTPRPIGCLMASKNGHALDMVAAKLIGLGPKDVPTLNSAVARNLVPASVEEVNVIGEMDEFVIPDYKTVPSQANVFFAVLGDGIPGKIGDFVAGRVIAPFPKLDPDICVGCGKCRSVCPAKAITMRKNKPHINRKICIHCFCCQEFCPKGALHVGRHLIMRVLGK